MPRRGAGRPRARAAERVARKQVLLGAGEQKPGPPLFNRCPSCESPYALEGKEVLCTVPHEEEPYLAGRMMVCANCGTAYMALVEGGVLIPKMSFGFRPTPERPQPTPTTHEPNGSPPPSDPLKWSRRRV